MSNAETSREDRFHEEVRDRDRKCVISGLSNPEYLIARDEWAGFEAAHIFPVRHENLWIYYNHGEWVTYMDDTVGSSKIHSIQKGLLLQATVDQLFDRFRVSVNLDDGYKVVVLSPEFF